MHRAFVRLAFSGLSFAARRDRPHPRIRNGAVQKLESQAESIKHKNSLRLSNFGSPKHVFWLSSFRSPAVELSRQKILVAARGRPTKETKPKNSKISRLGPSWCRLGPSWGCLGAVLGRLGAVLGPSWGHLGQSWRHLGPSWGFLGAFQGPSGATAALSERIVKIIEKPYMFQ